MENNGANSKLPKLYPMELRLALWIRACGVYQQKHQKGALSQTVKWDGIVWFSYFICEIL